MTYRSSFLCYNVKIRNDQNNIIAIDSEGGFIGSLGQQFDLECDAPICYINRDLECFIVSENAAEFLKNIESWKKNLKLYDKVTFYHSKTEAERELQFIDLTDLHSSFL